MPFTQRRYAHIATEGDSKHLTTMLCCCTILYVHTVQLTQPKNTEKRRKPMKTRVAKGMKSLIKSKCLRCLRQSALRTRLKGAPGLTLRSHCFALADRGSWQLVAARGCSWQPCELQSSFYGHWFLLRKMSKVFASGRIFSTLVSQV